MRKPFGRLLYEAAESMIRASGHGRVSLGTLPTAVPFCELMGLAVIGHRRATGALEGVTIALMEKELSPEAT
jgi:hypothetical protein